MSDYAPPAQGFLPNAIETCAAFLGLEVPMPPGTAPASVEPLASGAPQVTSAPSTTFTEGQQANFSVTAIGSPTPTLTVTGALPSGTAFNDYGNGTGAIGGQPAAGSAGVYDLVITATNTTGADTQDFALTVAAPGTVPTFEQSVVSCLLSIATDTQLMRMKQHQ